MMEKYGTYTVYRNIHTGAIKKVPLGEELEDELEKTGESSEDWQELDHDPEED